MPVINQGVREIVTLQVGQPIFVTSTGSAAFTYDQELVSSPRTVASDSGEVRIGPFEIQVDVTINPVVGSVSYSYHPSEFKSSASTTIDVSEALSQLALPVGAQSVLLFGDSFSDAQQSQNPVYLNECLYISCWRFVFGRYGSNLYIKANESQAGANVDDLELRYPSALQSLTDWVFMDIGQNDFYNNFTADYVAAKMQKFVSGFLNQGRKVIVLGCFPQVTTRASFTAARSLESQKYNKIMFQWARTQRGVYFIDTFSFAADWADTTNGGALTSMFSTDGIHLSVVGTIATADAVCKVLDRYTPRNPDLYLGQLNPTVMNVAESVMFGTAGTNGTGSTGQVASGWTASRSAGANGAIVASKITPVGQRLTITLSATNGDSTFRFFNGMNSGLTAIVGQSAVSRTKMRIRTTSGKAYLKQMSTRMFWTDGVTNFNQYNGRVQGSFSGLGDESFDTDLIVLDTYPLAVTTTASGSSGYYFEIEINSTAGAVIEIDIYSVDVYAQPTV